MGFLVNFLVGASCLVLAIRYFQSEPILSAFEFFVSGVNIGFAIAVLIYERFKNHDT